MRNNEKRNAKSACGLLAWRPHGSLYGIKRMRGVRANEMCGSKTASKQSAYGLSIHLMRNLIRLLNYKDGQIRRWLFK